MFVSARLPDENPRGPRRNPYDVSLPRWKVINKDDDLWLPDALAPVVDHDWVIAERMPTRARISYAVYRMMERMAVPLLRRFLESNAMHVGGFAPEDVQAVLDDLRRYAPNSVIQIPFPVENEADSHVYSITPPDDDQLSDLRALVRLERQVLPIHVLGMVGEKFVRLCFVKTGRYAAITQVARLGNVRAEPGTNRLDLMVIGTVDGMRYAVSVKNRREVMRRRSSWIPERIEMAKAHHARPWLIPAFVTADSPEVCRAQGVRCTPIGSRVAPEQDTFGRSVRKLLKALYPVIGGEPYVFMGAERIRGPEPDLVRAPHSNRNGCLTDNRTAESSARTTSTRYLPAS